jgi:hypothetical protein
MRTAIAASYSFNSTCFIDVTASLSSMRRLVIHLPETFPWKAEFQKVALALGATAG